MSTTKLKESGKSKKKEKSRELGDPKEVLRRNNFEKPKRVPHNLYKVKESDRKIVYSYAAYGATNEDIASALGIDNKTVTKYFNEELVTGRAVAKNTIAQRIYQIAIGREAMYDPETREELSPAIRPNLAALIFLAKTRLGWKETQIIEQNLEVQSGVQIYLPDNGMKVFESKALEIGEKE